MAVGHTRGWTPALPRLAQPLRPGNPSLARLPGDLRAMAAALAALTLVAAVPAALIGYVGAPFPADPDARTALTDSLSPASLVVVLSLAVWLLWAHLLWRLAAAARTCLRRRGWTDLSRVDAGWAAPARRLTAAALLYSGAAVLAAPLAGDEHLALAATEAAGSSDGPDHADPTPAPTAPVPADAPHLETAAAPPCTPPPDTPRQPAEAAQPARRPQAETTPPVGGPTQPPQAGPDPTRTPEPPEAPDATSAPGSPGVVGSAETLGTPGTSGMAQSVSGARPDAVAAPGAGEQAVPPP
ncbi:MAG: hypothetical protein IRZ08_21465, partial [Frankia sp.]|nr:hypothetical protein [Frankia sp.]